MLLIATNKIKKASKTIINKDFIKTNSMLNNVIEKSSLLDRVLDDGQTVSQKIIEKTGTLDPFMIATGLSTELGSHALKKITSEKDSRSCGSKKIHQKLKIVMQLYKTFYSKTLVKLAQGHKLIFHLIIP